MSSLASLALGQSQSHLNFQSVEGQPQPGWKKVATALKFANLAVAVIVSAAAINRFINNEVIPLDEYIFDIGVHVFQWLIVSKISQGSLSGKAAQIALKVTVTLSLVRISDMIYRLVTATTVVPVFLQFTDSAIHALDMAGTGYLLGTWRFWNKRVQVL